MISILNILNIVSIFLSVIFQILLIRSFGATLQTDAYFLTIGITQFINAIVIGLLTDLFIPVYNDIKIKGKAESLKFTGGIFLLVLIFSSVLAIVVYLIAPILIRIFATGFTVEKVIFSANLIKILSVSIIFSSLNGLMISALNANLFMTITYVAAITNPLLNIGVLILFTKTYGLNALVFSIVVGSILNFFLLFTYHSKKVGWKFSNPCGNQDIIYLLKKNFVMRAAYIINGLKGPITTNVLSYFPIGYITLFSYTDKILNILFKVTNSPMLSLLFIKVSNFLANKNMSEIKNVVKSTIKSNYLLFICVLVPTIILFKKTFGNMFASQISPEKINIMFSLFLSMIPYYLILSFELPFTNITIAMKKGSKVVEIAVVSIILYTFFLLLCINFLKIYTIPIAMLFAQMYNSMAYVKFVNNQYDLLDKDLIKTILLFITLGISVIFINLFMQDNFLFQLYSTLLAICLWLPIIGKDVISVFRLVTNKGEIK